MADNDEPPRDKFPPLKISAIVEGAHSIRENNKLEEFVSFCREHQIKFYVSRDKLMLIKRYFAQSSIDDGFVGKLKSGGDDCPPPTFECPQIDEG
jgi:hypothetical protein